VVIDSPPVLAAVDALLLIPHVDDILMVVDSTTRARDVGAALKALARGGRGMAHLWLVLNRVAGSTPRRPRRRRAPPAAVPVPHASPASLEPPRPLRRRPTARDSRPTT
jgi:hypothetical protein